MKSALREPIRAVIEELDEFEEFEARHLIFREFGSDWWWAFSECWNEQNDHGSWFQLNYPHGGTGWMPGDPEDCFYISLYCYFGTSPAEKGRRNRIVREIQQASPMPREISIGNEEHKGQVLALYLPLHKAININTLLEPQTLVNKVQEAVKLFVRSIGLRIPSI